MISDQIALSSIIIEIKETNYISKFERQDSGELFYLVYVENILWQKLLEAALQANLCLNKINRDRKRSTSFT